MGGKQNLKMAVSDVLQGATGDMKNNVSKLLREIRRMKLNVQSDIHGWTLGSPSSFLPVFHAALMQYSLPLANCIMAQGFELYSKSDLRFIHGVYGVLRNLLHFQPKLTKEQFLSNGYAERKVILAHNLLCLCQARHKQLITSANKGSVGSKKFSSLSARCSPRNPTTVLTVHRGTEVGLARSKGSYIHAEGLGVGQGSLPTSNSMALICNHDAPLPDLDVHPANHVDLTPTLTSSQHSSLSLPSSLTPSPAPARTESYDIRHSVDILSSVCGEEKAFKDVLVVRHNATLADMTERRRYPLQQVNCEAGGLKVNQLDTEDTADVENRNPLLQLLSCRVEELEKIVEQVLARCVLVETQLRLASSQQQLQQQQQLKQQQQQKQPLQQQKQQQQQKQPLQQQQQLEQQEAQQTGTRTDRECVRTRGEGGRESEWSSVVSNGRSVSGEMATSASCISASSHPNMNVNKSMWCNSTLYQMRDAATEDMTQVSHDCNETTPTSPKILATPPTPSCEETHQKIQSLRSRAQKTRMFLQQVTTSRGGHPV